MTWNIVLLLHFFPHLHITNSIKISSLHLNHLTGLFLPSSCVPTSCHTKRLQYHPKIWLPLVSSSLYVVMPTNMIAEQIRTTVTDLLKINHPVMLAGMNVAAGPKLAAAVTNAGGLGVIGGVRSWIPFWCKFISQCI